MNLPDVAVSVLVTTVILFVGLYTISMVSNVVALNSLDKFYNVFTTLLTNTGTLFDVMILVIIIVVLGVAVMVLRGFGSNRAIDG